MNRIWVLASVLCFPVAGFAADFDVGNRVFVKLDAAAAAFDGTEINANTIPRPAEIIQIKGNRFLLAEPYARQKSIQAWVHRLDVLRLDEALKYIDELIKQEPSDARLRLYRGSVWCEKHDSRKAIDEFTEAIRLDPNLIEAYMNRGLVCRRFVIDRKFDTTFEDFSQVIRLAPNDPKPYAWRAYNWDERGDIDKAIDDYSTAIKLGDTDGATYFYRGAYYQEKGEFDLALQDYLEGIRRDPDRGDFFQAIAWFRATFPEERYRNAKSAVEYAIKARDLDYWEKWKVLDALAAAYAEAGDFPNAIKSAESAVLAANPNQKIEVQRRLDRYTNGKPYRDPRVYTDVAWRRATSPVDQYRNGKIALEMAKKACELTAWHDWQALEALAASHAELGDFTRAAEFGEKSLNLAPEDRQLRATKRLELYRSNKPFRDNSRTRYIDRQDGE